MPASVIRQVEKIATGEGQDGDLIFSDRSGNPLDDDPAMDPPDGVAGVVPTIPTFDIPSAYYYEDLPEAVGNGGDDGEDDGDDELPSPITQTADDGGTIADVGEDRADAELAGVAPNSETRLNLQEWHPTAMTRLNRTVRTISSQEKTRFPVGCRTWCTMIVTAMIATTKKSPRRENA